MKKFLIIYICIAAVFISLTVLVQAQENKETKGEKWDKKQPVQITSDVLEAFNEKRLAIFSGNAVAIQGDVVIRSDKLLIYYKKATRETKSQETKDVEQAGDLDKIVAKGHVNISKGLRIATGDEAVFEQDSQKITMTGNAVMREGKNVIRGHRITLLMDENRGIVEAQERKRVTATIYTSDRKEIKDSGDIRK